MNNLNIFVFTDQTHSNVVQFVSDCQTEEQLLDKLKGDSTHISEIFDNMVISSEEGVNLAKRMLAQLQPGEWNDSAKRVSLVIRNLGFLVRNDNPDMTIYMGEEENVQAHLSVLQRETVYFRKIQTFKRLENGEFKIDFKGFPKETYQRAIEFFYATDDQRKELITNLEATSLVSLLTLANMWQAPDLTTMCDNQLARRLHDIEWNEEDVEWLKRFPISFDLYSVAEKVAKKLNQTVEVILKQMPDALYLVETMGLRWVKPTVGDILEQMTDPTKAKDLALKCTVEELETFAVRETTFGNACLHRPNYHGPAYIAKYYGIVDKPPPLPEGTDEILLSNEPDNRGKKVWETHTLYLRPERVNEQDLTLEHSKHLAKNPLSGGHRVEKFSVSKEVRELFKEKPVGKSEWVLSTNQPMSGTKSGCAADHRFRLESFPEYEFPKTINAVWLELLHNVSTEECLYGRDPLAYTKCQEGGRATHCSWEVCVGSSDQSCLNITTQYLYIRDKNTGVKGSRKLL